MLDTKDILEIRKDFPILSQTMNGKAFVYLDNAATSQKPWSVINKITEYYTTYNANVHRGFYTISERATFEVEEVREKISRFIKATRSDEIIFTSGATESSNLLTHGLTPHLGVGNEVLLGQLEHNSQAAPWLALSHQLSLHLQLIPFTEDGLFDLSTFANLLTDRTKVIALTYVSNFLGTIQPITEMVQKARQINKKVIIILDASQAAPYLPMDVQELDVDFLYFSAHKMLGPMGVGVLWGKRERLEDLLPLKIGGGSVKEIQGQLLFLKSLPDRLEAGTPNVEGIIGLGAALDYLNAIGMDQIASYEKHLLSCIRESLGRLPSFKLIVKDSPPQIAMATGFFDKLNSHDVVAYLDAKGIAVRSGQLCSYLIAQTLKTPSVIRASFYFYNTVEEVDILREAFIAIKRTLQC